MKQLSGRHFPLSVPADPVQSHEGPDDSLGEIIAEDWPTYWTQVPVWVLLSGVSGQAYKTYALLAEHINARQPGRRIACPKQKAIARVLGLKKPSHVAKYTGELEDLGAVRVEEYRYANGMRRGYRYHVRFNPPPGYAGLVSLSQFYEANDDLKGTLPVGRTRAALASPREETAGRAGGAKKGTSGDAKKGSTRGPSDGVAKRDQEERDQEERDGAPSARSAPDARRATHVSNTRAGGGSAASGQAHPRLTREQKQAIQTVRDLLPHDLNRALPVRTPRNVTDAILEALAADQPHERTPAQLAERRVAVRWDGHWAREFYAGRLPKQPIGPLLAMLRRDPECGDPRCDDRVNVDTGQPCTACSVRRQDRVDVVREPAREHPQPEEAAAPVERGVGLPVQRPSAVVDDSFGVRPECANDMCGRPLPRGQEDGLCPGCALDPQLAEV